MPNKPRKEARTERYHVYVRGVNREKIFNQKREKNYFKRIIREYKEECNVEIYSYCIMSNHSHLIIKSELEELSMFMSKVLAKYAKYYNYKHDRNGHVFQNRFGSECIEDEIYFLNCLRYIHMNPVKALMVPAVTDYKYSSMKEYREGKADILHENALTYFKECFKNWENFLEYHHHPNARVFIDTKEEVYLQLQEQALLVLYKFQEEYALENTVEVLEDPLLRETYKDKLKEALNISIKVRDTLYQELRKKFIG